MSRVKERKNYSIQVVDNALSVLEAFTDHGDEVRLSSLSESLGMRKANVFRLLATFENRGYIEKKGRAGTYSLGLSAYALGQRFLYGMKLFRMARPVMERLAKECDEAVYLAVSQGENVLLLDMVNSTQQIAVKPLVGNCYPLPLVAPGRVFMAFAGEQGKDAAGQIFPQELHHIRWDRFCVERGGFGPEIAALAVPFFNAAGEIFGCLCIVGPDFRLTEKRVREELLPNLREAGENISFKLGHRVAQAIKNDYFI